mgnify:FL=1
MDDHSEPVSADAFGKLKVFGHDSHPLGMDGAQVSVLEQRHQIGLSCLLEGQNSLTLESNFLFELSSDLTDESLERQLPDEQVSLNKLRKGKSSSTSRVGRKMKSYALLEFSDLSEGNRSGFESVGLLHSGDDGGGFPGDLLGG